MTDLISAPVVVVAQRPKMLSTRTEYDLYDPAGAPLGSIVEQSGSGKWLLGKLAEVHWVVADASGQPVLVLDKPGSWGRQHFSVLDAAGTQLGEVQQESIMFAPQFDLRASDGSVGRLDGGRMWSWEWTLEGSAGQPVGRVTKQFGGLASLFTNADHFVVELGPELTGPFRAVALVASICLDIVREQNERHNNA